MNTISKILAPATLALFAFGAQAADMVGTGGESYKGNTVVAAVSNSSETALGERVNTGGEAYAGVANRSAPTAGPAAAGLSREQLERLYLG